MQQLSLFVDGFDAFEQARSHLRRLDLPRARAAVERARHTAATSNSTAAPNHLPLHSLERALAWLLRHLPAPPTAASAAAALAALPHTVAAQHLDVAAADDAELGLVHFLLPHLPEPPAPLRFLDPDQRLPSPLVRALAGDATTARREFDDLLAAHADRADLWFGAADACWRTQHLDEANTNYVRALLLDPQAIDPRRLAHPGLRTCWQRLSDVLRPEQVERLLRAATAAPARQFALLLYLDRTAPTTVDLPRRERMAELDPAGFARFLDHPRAAIAPATRGGRDGRMSR